MLMRDCTDELRADLEQALAKTRLLKTKLNSLAADPKNAVRSSAMEILALLHALHALAGYVRSQECTLHGPPSPWTPMPGLAESINQKLAAYSDEPYQFRLALEATEGFAFRLLEHSLTPVPPYYSPGFRSAWVRWARRYPELLASAGPEIPFPDLIEGVESTLQEMLSTIDRGRLTVMRPDYSEP